MKKEYKTSTTLKRGQEYTFSVETSLLNAEVDVYIGLDYFIGRTVGQKITFEISRVVTSRDLIVDTGSGGDIIERVKLEKGSKATDWTPAPEDERDYINSQIEISAESIKSTVSSDVNSKFSYVNQRVDSITSVVAGKASSTRVSQLENSWAVRYLNDRDDVVSEINLSKDGVYVSGDFITSGTITGNTVIAEGTTRGIELSRYGRLSFEHNGISAGSIFAEPSPEGLNKTDIYIKTAARLRTNSIAANGDVRPETNNSRWLGNLGNRWHKLTLGSGGIDESSDARLKSDIQNIPDELVDYFKDIHPKMYKMSGNTQFGYIAQEVEGALFKYANKTYGIDIARKNKEVFNIVSQDESYLGLVYKQVSAIKDAQHEKEIEDLKQKVNLLESKVV